MPPRPTRQGDSRRPTPGVILNDMDVTLGGLKLLVVEDDDDTRELLRVLLQANGANVTAVASVPEALTAYDDTRPDVLIADIGMPEYNGYTLIGRVRARDREERGRMVPAMSLMTASIPGRYRGGFMSLNSAVQQFASGLAAYLSGRILGQSATGEMTRFPTVGLIAVVCALTCIYLARFLKAPTARESVGPGLVLET